MGESLYTEQQLENILRLEESTEQRGHLSLWSCGGGTMWCVSDSLDRRGWPRLASGCVTWCPASPRAALTHSHYSDNWGSWRYRRLDCDLSHCGGIHVSCDTHQH